MNKLKIKNDSPRRFLLSPRNRILSSPKLTIDMLNTEQQQRVRNYTYKKSNLLGKGYSSKVYKAHKVGQTFKSFAIKIIDLSQLNYQQRKNLQIQLKLHKGLQHPNIVKCYDTFKSTTSYYLILQYCHNGTLSDYLKNHKKLDQSSVINIISQVFQGFLYLINKKILHRDLKPQNILRKDNIWKISDFGFSCTLQDQFYQDDMNVGTPLYMPPQSLTKDIYSHKSDIFSLGITVYKMLTGNTPWRCSTEKQLICLMFSQKIQFPTLKNKYLDQFLKRSLELNIQKRLDVQQFKELFKNIKQEQTLIEKVQRELQFSKNLKKYESNKSTTTAQSLSSSKNNQIQTSNQQSFITSAVTENNEFENETQQNILNKNIVLQQLELYRIIHHFLLNIDSFLVQQNFINPQSGVQVHTNIKEVLVIFFYKYTLKNIRILNSFFTGNSHQSQLKQFRHFDIKNFDLFTNSSMHQTLGKLVKEKLNFYQAQFLELYIKKSILTIRFINKRFPQLSQNNLALGKLFYQSILQFLKPLIQQLNVYILENLQKVKNVNRNMKKDRVLALAFWIRIYVQFMIKMKGFKQLEINQQIYIEPIEKINLNDKKEVENYKQNKKDSSMMVNDLQNGINELKKIRQKIKIQFIYNFKQTSLQYKYALELRKIWNEVQKLNEQQRKKK